MNLTIHELKVAVNFLKQAQVLCDGVQGFFEGDVDFAARLNETAGALGKDRSYIERLIASMSGANMDSEDDGGIPTEKAPAEKAKSRIEEINAQLVECEQLSHELDELTEKFAHVMPENLTQEDAILKSDVDDAERSLLDRMGSLADVLTLERPQTVNDILIFALRALAPLRELIMAVSKEHSYERKQGEIAYRLLQRVVPALEDLASVTRAELGFHDEYHFGLEAQTEREVIEKLKAVLAQKTADPSP